jgi:tetratricopeptide (TPR) repeat protein
MKRILICLMVLSAVIVTAQEQDYQSGTPATLEAANGKKAKVFLQRLEGDNLTFQPFKSPTDMTVPASKIKSLEFYPKYDEAAVNDLFNSGDFAGVLNILEPVMPDYFQYMAIDNNMLQPFVLMYSCYRFTGDFENAEIYANKLLECSDETLQLKGKVGLALVAIQKGQLGDAEKLRLEVAEKSDAAGLFLRASIERAEGEPKTAIQTVTTIIEDHANDLEWLPSSELLTAYCYLDMVGTNSVITTNSALNTARQVKNMYSGTAVAVDATKLWVSLGGAEIAAAEAVEKAEREAARKEAEERRAAEKKARKEAEAAAKAAKAAAVPETGVNTSTKSESE